MDDVILNKAAIVERCIRRVREVYAGNASHLRDDATRQDSIILNIQRACEASIDLAMHLVRKGALGLPQDSRDAFDLLTAAGWVPAEIAAPLKRMVGFRNIAVHDYRSLSLDVVQAIVEKNLDDLAGFARHAVTHYA